MRVWVNGLCEEVRDGMSVATLLSSLDLREAMVAVAVNESFVPKGDHAQHVLQDGDRIEIVAPMQGG